MVGTIPEDPAIVLAKLPLADGAGAVPLRPEPVSNPEEVVLSAYGAVAVTVTVTVTGGASLVRELASTAILLLEVIDGVAVKTGVTTTIDVIVVMVGAGGTSE